MGKNSTIRLWGSLFTSPHIWYYLEVQLTSENRKSLRRALIQALAESEWIYGFG